MNGQELKSIIVTAQKVQSGRDKTLAEMLQREIQNLESIIESGMGKSYHKLHDDQEIPEDIVTAAEYLTSCHGLWMYLFFIYNYLSLLIWQGFF